MVKQSVPTPYIQTIIIVADPHDIMRGYSLLGREFILKEPTPRHDEAITLEGYRYLDNYWVVSKEEYMRVVPEATYEDFDSDEMYIPVYVARPSFRPRYVKRTKIDI